MKLLFLDTETTGLDPEKHAVIQISGIVEIDGEVKEEFDLRCKPFHGEMVSKEALAVNGITMAQLMAFDDPDKTHRRFYTLLDKYCNRYDKKTKFTMVGQNPKFDYDFLNKWFRKNGDIYWYSYVDYHLIDLIAATALMSLAGRLKVENMKLATVAAALGIEHQAHDALGDIRATRAAFHKYIDMARIQDKQLALEPAP